MLSLEAGSDLALHVGELLGSSRPLLIGQPRIAEFAQLTEDPQWIHVDVERARRSPFGTTVAQGYLTLAMIPTIMDDVLVVRHIASTLNYGLNRVRFPQPVPAGSTVVGTVRLSAATARSSGMLAEFHVDITVEGHDQPCCVADPLIYYVAQ